MAYPGKIITHPITGEIVEFLETSSSSNGQLLKMRVTTPPGVGPPFLHYHIHQEEEFFIVKGEIELIVGGWKGKLKENQCKTVPVSGKHNYKNSVKIPSVKIVEMRPAGKFEYFVENMVGLAMDGKTNAKGIPGSVQMVMTQYETGIYISGIPVFIQNLVWKVCRWIGKLKGIEAYYPKYSE